MKTTPITNTLLAFAAMLGGASAQLLEAPETAEEAGVLPSQKKAAAAASRVTNEARNPFASRTKSSGGPVTAEAETEESRIRAVLERFSINGISKTGDGGYSAQAGPLTFREGERLPHLIDGQVDNLRVSKVTARLVEITWVGDEDAVQPRQISIPIDMTATVQVTLPSPNDGGRGPKVIIGSAST